MKGGYALFLCFLFIIIITFLFIIIPFYVKNKKKSSMGIHTEIHPPEINREILESDREEYANKIFGTEKEL